MNQENIKFVRLRDHQSYWTMTVLCLLLPIVGILVGAIMMTKDHKIDRKLGEHMIVLSIVMSFISAFLWLIFVALVRGLAGI